MIHDATPAPWIVNKYGGIGSGENGTAQLIIGATTGWAHDWTDRERARHDADLRLIVAAPAMAKALYSALIAMKLAAALPGVADEYDFAPCIAELAAAIRDLHS